MNYYFDENFVNFINSPFLLFLQLTLLWQEKQNYVHNEHKSWDSHLHKTWCRTRLHEPECQRLSKETNTAVAHSLVTWHRDVCIRGFVLSQAWQQQPVTILALPAHTRSHPSLAHVPAFCQTVYYSSQWPLLAHPMEYLASVPIRVSHVPLSWIPFFPWLCNHILST